MSSTGRQRLVVDLDGLEGVGGRVAVAGDHHGDARRRRSAPRRWPAAGEVGILMSSVTGQTHGMRAELVAELRSPEKAATTPGVASAGETSMRVIRACAIGLRRMRHVQQAGQLRCCRSSWCGR